MSAEMRAVVLIYFLCIVGRGLLDMVTATTTTTIADGAIMTTPGEWEGGGPGLDVVSEIRAGENRIIGHEILADTG